MELKGQFAVVSVKTFYTYADLYPWILFEKMHIFCNTAAIFIYNWWLNRTDDSGFRDIYLVLCASCVQS